MSVCGTLRGNQYCIELTPSFLIYAYILGFVFQPTLSVPVVSGVESLKIWSRLKCFRANRFIITNFGIIKTFFVSYCAAFVNTSYTVK